MSAPDLNVVYTDLSQLLTDICSLLTNVVSGKVSPSDKENASALIKKSKQQLQVISIISMPDYDSGRYMDMGKKQPVIPDADPLYSPVEDTISEKSSKSFDVALCPYNNLSAHDASIDKFGDIERREKFLLYYHKKIFAAVCDKWLLLYANKQDTKPYEAHDLESYKVKFDANGKDRSFQLVSTDEKKELFLIAYNAKDALQWVTAIERNKSGDKTFGMPVSNITLNTTPTNTPQKQAKIARSPSTSLLKSQSNNLNRSNKSLQQIGNSEDTPLDEIYEELQPGRPDEPVKEPPVTPTKSKAVPPPRVPQEPTLPQRNPKRDIPPPMILKQLPPLPKPDPIQMQASFDDDSFSEEDEEDQVYHVIGTTSPVRVTPTLLPQESIEDEFEEDLVEYDSIEDEKEPAKQITPPPPAKPVPNVKPKYLWLEKKLTPPKINIPKVFERKDSNNSFIHKMHKI